jgi:hypothetical protein
MAPYHVIPAATDFAEVRDIPDLAKNEHLALIETFEVPEPPRMPYYTAECAGGGIGRYET